MVAGQERTALLAEAPVKFQRCSGLAVWCSKGGTIQLFFSVWDALEVSRSPFHGFITVTTSCFFFYYEGLPLFSKVTAVSSFYFSTLLHDAPVLDILRVQITPTKL